MDRETRNAIQRATQQARRLLEEDYASQLEATHDVLPNGEVAATAGAHLNARQRLERDKIVAAIDHKRAAGMRPAEAVSDYVRDAAFTTLNRFVALKMLEARDLVLECITKGDQSSGYKEFCGAAPGVALLPDGAGYRIYLESLFDELSTELKVLFERRDTASVLWPRRTTFDALLAVLNGTDLQRVWAEDETIGWVYQYFNSQDERGEMRDAAAAAPRNSRELATRNQFFTPRYVVRFLTDNTLGRLWWEMRQGDTVLKDRCDLLAIAPDAVPQQRAKKDPRDIKVLDPACGSGHFLLYVFDLLLVIYDEAWADPNAPVSELTGKSLRADYSTQAELRAAVPELIIRHNLYGVDIDPRCVQVAALALWLRAQRSFNEHRIPRAERPRIRRSHIVLAEPMPKDAGLVKEFASRLSPPILGELFERMVSVFDLAGELGLLLKVERMLDTAIRDAERASRQGELFGGQQGSRAFWAQAEEKLLEALAAFGNVGEGRAHHRHLLFRDDAAHGLALLDVARTKFDVVVMNPPFGDPTENSRGHVEGAYPDSRQNIFAVFVDRAVRDLTPNGFVGVLSTDAGFFRRTLEAWRRNVVLANTTVEAFGHLGDNVLDGARVRVAAYALSTPSRRAASATYIRAYAMDRESRQPALEEGVRAIRAGTASARLFQTTQAEYEKLPYAVFGYWCSPQLRDVFVDNQVLEGNAGRARQGLATAADFRFLRLRWEVQPERVAQNAWMPFAKGGEYSPFYDDVHLVVTKWEPGSELEAFDGSVIRNPDYYGKPGITWPRRTNKRFAPRILPSGCAFGDKGPSVVDIPRSPWPLLATLNSRVASYLMGFGTGATETMDQSNSYEVGLVQRLPIASATQADALLERQAKRAWAAQAALAAGDETTGMFDAPCPPGSLVDGVEAAWLRLCAGRVQEVAAYVEAQVGIDQRVCELYRLNAQDWQEIESNVGDVHRPDVPTGPANRRLWGESIVSFLVGCAFGRWRASRLTDGRTHSPDDALLPPVGHRDEVPAANAILVSDSGHPNDIARACEAALEGVLGQRAAEVLTELSGLLDSGDDLGRYLVSEFFERHENVYSKSKRSAPIYLPLAPASGQYGVWLYLHRLTPETLFTVIDDFVVPKVRFEENRLTELQAAAAGRSTAASRRAVTAQEDQLNALRAMLDDLRRVAPLWRPNLDDGVVINFAPLWRLFPRPAAWRNLLRDTWQALVDGEYDWSHMAMRLWPARVVPKCTTDRSLAIAHGLEDDLWQESSEGAWRPRSPLRRSVDDIVRERESPAVRTALQSLLDAPEPGAARGRRRRGGGDA